MTINVIYVRDFLNAKLHAGTKNFTYIGDDGDLFRLNGMTLNENSPPIYVSERVTVGRFMDAAMSRFHSIYNADYQNEEQQPYP